EAADEVDLLGGLALAEELLDGLDRAGLDAREPVQLEGAAQDVEDVRLDGAVGGEPLGEAGQGCGACHGADPPITGGPRARRPLRGRAGARPRGRPARLAATPRRAPRAGGGWPRAPPPSSSPGRA